MTEPPRHNYGQMRSVEDGILQLHILQQPLYIYKQQNFGYQYDAVFIAEKNGDKFQIDLTGLIF